MVRTIAFLIAALAFTVVSAKVTLPQEELTYAARYHCGLIKLTAGEVKIKVKLDGNQLTATFNGKSVPIAKRVYIISDTLHATMIESCGPSREAVTYENGWYAKPKAEHSETAKIDHKHPEAYKTIQDQGELDASANTMEAVAITADMLALFYYFRQIDFAGMTPGQTINIPISLPDGDVQQLEIVYKGLDNYDDRDSYKVVYSYSYHGEMSKYPVTTQVDRITKLPLLMSAEIKIGHVELELEE